jgi:hypothetical protein
VTDAMVQVHGNGAPQGVHASYMGLNGRLGPLAAVLPVLAALIVGFPTKDLAWGLVGLVSGLLVLALVALVLAVADEDEAKARAEAQSPAGRLDLCPPPIEQLAKGHTSGGVNGAPLQIGAQARQLPACLRLRARKRAVGPCPRRFALRRCEGAISSAPPASMCPSRSVVCVSSVPVYKSCKKLPLGREL